MKTTVLLVIISAISLFGLSEEKGKTRLANHEQKLLNELRLTYYKAVEEEDSIPELEEFIAKNYTAISEINKALAFAYTAGIDAVKSKHAFWPLTKLNYLEKSLETLASAVKIEPDNLEVRFMRFSILHYVPGFLGYSNERNEDAKVIYKELLKKNYSILDKKIQKGIYEFLVDSERLSEKESELLIIQLKGQFSHE